MRNARHPRPAAAVVTLIDAHTAVIDRCENGLLRRLESISSLQPRRKSNHMGDAPRVGFHGGTRGETAAEAAQRARETERDHFIARVAPLVAAASIDTWIVLGGNPIFVNALHAALESASGRDAIRAEGLFVAMPAEGLVAGVEAAVDARIAIDDLANVQQLIERTGAHTTGVVGPMATLDAIEHGAAEIVLMTPHYRAQHALDAERIAAAAHAKGGRVDIVIGAPAATLDASAGGVGALLRFALHTMPKPGYD